MSTKSLVGENLVSLLDFAPEDLERIIELAGKMKANRAHYAAALTGKTLLMSF